MLDSVKRCNKDEDKIFKKKQISLKVAVELQS